MPNTITEQAQRFAAGAVEWVKERWDALDLFDSDPERVAKAENSPWWALGSMWYFVWMVVIVSGLYLIIYYIPTTDAGWESIRHIQDAVALGWVARGLHKYGADALIILGTMRVYRMVLTGEYKRPNELNYIFAILLLLFGMYSGLTGYLLIWNQRAFWATKVFATFPTYLDQNPLWLPGAAFINNLNIGKTTAQILVGGTAIGQKTITNFYALHFAFSGILLILAELRLWRKGWRSQWKRINLSWQSIAALLVILLLVTAILPPEQGSPADPTKTPLPILSDWYFLAMYQMLKYMRPYWATLLTMALPVFAIMMVIFDRRPEKHWRDRPMAFTMTVMGFVYWIAFSVLIMLDIANINRDPPIWYNSAVLFFLVGTLWDWRYLKRHGKLERGTWFTWHPWMLAATLWVFSLNVLWNYFHPFFMLPLIKWGHVAAIALILIGWAGYGMAKFRVVVSKTG